MRGVIKPEDRFSPSFRLSRSVTSPIPKQENVSSIMDEAEGFEKSLLSKVIRLET